MHPAGGTKLAAAVQYTLNEKKYLYRFLDDPDLPIDNNRVENAIRPFVIGRKNWLFSDSVKGAEAKGAEASAMLYSLTVTATANGFATLTFSLPPGSLSCLGSIDSYRYAHRRPQKGGG